MAIYNLAKFAVKVLKIFVLVSGRLPIAETAE